MLSRLARAEGIVPELDVPVTKNHVLSIPGVIPAVAPAHFPGRGDHGQPGERLAARIHVRNDGEHRVEAIGAALSGLIASSRRGGRRIGIGIAIAQHFSGWEVGMVQDRMHVAAVIIGDPPLDGQMKTTLVTSWVRRRRKIAPR